MPKTTIKEIAKAANVSATAVSMALNNRTGVSKQTRDKIARIAKELNYVPNYAARSLISKQSCTIGVIVTDIADPFYPELAKGIEEKANALGYNMILSNTGRSPEKEKQCIDSLVSKGVDGIIFATVVLDDPYITPLIGDRFPFVAINRIPLKHPKINKIDYVIIDSYTGGYKAVEHLYRLGHDRIAIIAGNMKVSTAVSRTKGAKKALADYGLKFDPRLFIECNYSAELAHQAAQRLLAMKTPPTAIFAQDDSMALGVREAVLSAGLKIPEDLAIVGFDDINVCALTGIELTTISQKKYEMGIMAAKILIDKITGETPSMVNKIVLDAELIIRKSCGYSRLGAYRR